MFILMAGGGYIAGYITDPYNMDKPTTKESQGLVM